MRGLASSRHAPAGFYRTVSASASSSELAPHRISTPPGRPQSTPLEIVNPAPTARNDTNGHDGLESPTLELVRFTKIVRRLKWKLPFLEEGYRQAVSRVGQDSTRVAETELMFKLDFFEFYALIERALVHLMGVFGIRISSRSHQQSQHSYHANVLGALNSVDNPLHGILGTGEVRRQLGRAKDLRNRWKTAAEDHDDGDNLHQGTNGSHDEYQWRTNKMAAPLESYKLGGILGTIFTGFDVAFAVAQRYVENGGVRPENEANKATDVEDVDMVDWAIAAAASAGGVPDDDEDQWHFITDAMDWEAV